MPATNFIQVFMRTAINVWFCLNSIGAVGCNKLTLMKLLGEGFCCLVWALSRLIDYT